MSQVLAALALVALAVWAGAHVALVIGIARRSWWRALLALVVTPLAPHWGWAWGKRRRTYVWLGAIAAYALLVGAAGAA